MTMTESQQQSYEGSWEAGVSQPPSARDAVNEMLEAGLLDG